jgi:hypothetical protein
MQQNPNMSTLIGEKGLKRQESRQEKKSAERKPCLWTEMLGRSNSSYAV